ncbi:hypothetical protein Tco_1104358 [Tanacetum coccineum]
MEGNSIQLRLNDIKQQGVGSESLDGGITESMNRPRIKEDIYTARTPIGRQSVGGITNQKAMINLDIRMITMHYKKSDESAEVAESAEIAENAEVAESAEIAERTKDSRECRKF